MQASHRLECLVWIPGNWVFPSSVNCHHCPLAMTPTLADHLSNEALVSPLPLSLHPCSLKCVVPLSAKTVCVIHSAILSTSTSGMQLRRITQSFSAKFSAVCLTTK